MGKKTKTGKARRDKYYDLAKESGYRSRAAFKLLQINRKFEFLQSARILLDLCAAPGSWLQVAKEVMPPQHKIIGVDLVPIQSIPTVDTIQADITTPQCRQALSRMLQHAKVDVVLHDGAPNVGTAWNIDEFQQAHLCLQAFALATEFLVKNGTFVSKVFRSRDYEPLKWVFDQFFHQVKAMKPEASRLESAEIYLVCQRYRAPDYIDPKFFDHRFVFKEVDGAGGGDGSAAGGLKDPLAVTNNSLINLWHPEKAKRKRDGYEDGDTLFYALKASEFLESKDFLLLLARANKIILDTEPIQKHAENTEELRSYFDDIKVLGKSELKKIIKWRKTLLKSFEIVEEPKKMEVDAPVKTSEEIAEEELLRLREAEKKELKKKLKKQRLQHKKLQTRIHLKMHHPTDRIEQVDDDELFSLVGLQKRRAAAEANDDNISLLSADVDLDALEPVRDHVEETDALELQKVMDHKYEALNGGLEPPPLHIEKTQAGLGPYVWDKEKVEPVDSDIEMETLKPQRDGYSSSSDDDSELGAEAGPARKKLRPLTAVEKALAVKLIQSSKQRRDLEEATYNRFNFAYNEGEDAPAFFVHDERRHYRKNPPVTKAEVDAHRPKDVNVRTSKKAEQAKMRKRRRMLRQVKKLKQRVENLPDELTDKERVLKLREIYKKSGLRKKRKPTNTIVMNAGGKGREARPNVPGGKVKQVDRRMKADLRGQNKMKNKAKGGRARGGRK